MWTLWVIVRPEVKEHQKRATMMSSGVRDLIPHGDRTLIESRIDAGSSFLKASYSKSRSAVFESAATEEDCLSLQLKAKSLEMCSGSGSRRRRRLLSESRCDDEIITCP